MHIEQTRNKNKILFKKNKILFKKLLLTYQTKNDIIAIAVEKLAIYYQYAGVAELADAIDSGTNTRDTGV